MSYAHLSSLRVHEAAHRGRTCARIAVKVSPQLQTCVVTWRSIQESLSSNVTFAAAGFVIQGLQETHSKESFRDRQLKLATFKVEDFLP